MKEILTKALSLLIVLILSTTSLYAQNKTIEKPQKKTPTTTTTTQQKPKTNTSISSHSSSSTTTKPTTGTINGHEWVDLGLSVKWATCNVGASSPSGYGNYYAWGETSTKSEYTTDNSKTYGKSMGSIAGNSQYDVARANWGGSWRLPTASEIDELVDKCKYMRTTQGEHNGYLVTGPNGNSIFFPAGGWRFGVSLYGAGGRSNYWSSSPAEDSAHNAYILYFQRGNIYRSWSCHYFGRSVRPVSE